MKPGSALAELGQLLRDVRGIWTRSESLPDEERALARRGIPKHALDGVALLSMRAVPSAALPSRANQDGRRVLALHGYAGQPKSLAALRTHLAKNGFAPASVDLREPETMRGKADIVARWIMDEVEPSEPIPLVAHSMGGTVARLALRDDDVARRVERLITLGSPHAGTQIADVVDFELACEMERDSTITETLNAQTPWPETLPRLICFWSRADLLMVPPETACADGAEHRELEGVTHYGYMVRPHVFRAVLDALRA